jgi:hypothetical protein
MPLNNACRFIALLILCLAAAGCSDSGSSGSPNVYRATVTSIDMENKDTAAPLEVGGDQAEGTVRIDP